jgi:hypothetical protein
MGFSLMIFPTSSPGSFGLHRTIRPVSGSRMISPVFSSIFASVIGKNGYRNAGTNPTAPTLLSMFARIYVEKVKRMDITKKH